MRAQNDDDDDDDDDQRAPTRRRQAPEAPRRRLGVIALAVLGVAAAGYVGKAATQPPPRKCDLYETIPGDVCEEPGHTCDSINHKSDCMWHLECKSSWLPGFRAEWAWVSEPGYCFEDGTKPPPPPTYEVRSRVEADQKCPRGWAIRQGDRVAVYAPCGERTKPDRNGATTCIPANVTVAASDVAQAEQAGARVLTADELFGLNQPVNIQCYVR